MNNSFDSDNQCELSYELLHLLQWLTDQEVHALKKLIIRVVNDGLSKQLVKPDGLDNNNSSKAVQNSIVDFLDLLDALLHETLNEHSVKKAQQQNLMTSINKIDASSCDTDTVQLSLDKVSAQLELKPEANAKEVLFKEILKRWKPSKKRRLN
ncbi:MAG: hypothetical protein WDZ41_04650 [Candidatus Babeliales bacterium]